tara:strand:+ start:392 stop:664 length:273 start_codon:yes stop_codon:yes gene_type:complete
MNNKIDGFTMFTWMCAGFMLMIVGVCILSIPLMLLWNWLMPYLFGLPTINILQAVGLGALSHILFGNTGSIIRQSSTGHKKGSKKTLLFD